MAWRCSGSTNKDLITNLFSASLITSPTVRSAMLLVDRAHYTPKHPYEDSPQSIGHGATISAPHMHAHAVEALLPSISERIRAKEPVRILDVGSGSGYLTHVFAETVQALGGDDAYKTAKVVGIEHIGALVELSKNNMAKSAEGKRLLDTNVVEFVKGDGRLGHTRHAPYDAIHVGAAAAEWHAPLTEQLRNGGKLFIPVGTGSQYIWLVEKDGEGKVKRTKMFGVRYVPLTDAPQE
jgi:protein-L-isoaspartate(D-aspartate) O-methyltransferase